MTFGELLKRFREERDLSPRQLGKLTDIDHAYIYRLETGEKESPSQEIISKLSRALKLDGRRVRIMKYMLGRSVDQQLVSLVLDEAEHTIDDFESAAEMSYRGARPTNSDGWRRLLQRVKEIREEIEAGG